MVAVLVFFSLNCLAESETDFLPVQPAKKHYTNEYSKSAESKITFLQMRVRDLDHRLSELEGKAKPTLISTDYDLKERLGLIEMRLSTCESELRQISHDKIYRDLHR